MCKSAVKLKYLAVYRCNVMVVNNDIVALRAVLMNDQLAEAPEGVIKIVYIVRGERGVIAIPPTMKFGPNKSL